MSSFMDRVIVAAARKAYGNDQIGGVAVYGVTPEWFQRQYAGFLQVHEGFKPRGFMQVVEIMEGLYLLDAEDLVGI